MTKAMLKQTQSSWRKVFPTSLLLLLFAVSYALASTVEIQAPGVSVQADKTTDAARIQIGQANITVQPGAQPSPDGTMVDLIGSWKFKTDREENGEAQGWQKPEFDDTTWAMLNVPEAWEEQGIKINNPRWPAAEPEHGYNGYAWYRRHFTVPAAWANQRVVLKIGAIDDFDWTYVNGQLVGSTTGNETWDVPREYTIPLGLLKPEADNVVAIKVCDLQGSGGIITEPVAFELVAAPPVEQPEKQTGAYSKTRDDIVRIGGSVTVEADEMVEGDVVAVGGSADIYGYVTGTVVSVGGSVNAHPGATIDGDAVAVGGFVNQQEGATVNGEVVSAGPGFKWMPNNWRERLQYHGAAKGNFVAGLVIWGFISVLAVLLLRRRVETMAEALPLHPGAAAGLGLLGIALTPAAIVTVILASILVIVLLVITIVGILAIPAVVAAILALTLAPIALLFFGMSGVFLSLGQAVIRQLRRDIKTRAPGREGHPFWAVLLGVFIVCLAGLLPTIGPLVWATVVIFGYGLAIITKLGSAVSWRSVPYHSYPTPPPASFEESEPLVESEATMEALSSEQIEEPEVPATSEQVAPEPTSPPTEQNSGEGTTEQNPK